MRPGIASVPLATPRLPRCGLTGTIVTGIFAFQAHASGTHAIPGSEMAGLTR